MPRLKQSERRLIAAFVGCLALAGGLLAFGALLRERTRLSQEWSLLSAEHNSGQRLLEERPLWDARSAWLETHQPALEDPGVAQGELLATIQAAAKDRMLTVAEQTLLEPERTPHALKIPVRIRVIGPLQTVVDWVAEFRDPEAFRAVDQFLIVPEKSGTDQEPLVSCTLQISRLHTPAGPAPTPTTSP